MTTPLTFCFVLYLFYTRLTCFYCVGIVQLAQFLLIFTLVIYMRIKKKTETQWYLYFVVLHFTGFSKLYTLMCSYILYNIFYFNLLFKIFVLILNLFLKK